MTQTAGRIIALAETIRTLGEVPSGHLYAAAMSQMSLAEYDRAIEVLIRAGIVAQSNFMLRWVGPAVKES